jgi:hypothetical protein
MASLKVDLAELLEGLRLLARTVKPAKAGEAILRYEDGQFVVRLGGGEISAAATGRWPGEARLGGESLLAAMKQHAAEDPLPVHVESGHLHLGRLAVPCQWQQTGAAQVEIPIGATIGQILQIAMEHTDATLEQSGVLALVLEARARHEALVNQAAIILRPLGVQQKDVERLVQDCNRIRVSRPPEEVP